MHAPEWASLRHILAIRLDNIGDVVLLAPALKAIKTAAPLARLTLMATPAGSQVAPLIEAVDDVIVERPVWQDISGAYPFDPARQQALIADLAQRQFEAALIFTSFRQSPYPPAYCCYLAGVPLRIGQSKEFGGQVLTHWVIPPPDTTHQRLRNLHLLNAVGIPAREAGDLIIPSDATARADRLLRGAGIRRDQPFVAIVPGASCEARRYPAERFIAVTKLLRRRGLQTVVLGAARECQGNGWDGAGPSLAGKTSVPEFAAVVQRAAAIVCNNSSALHFAEAMGRPSVCLYSGTDYEEQWRPRLAPAQLLRRDTDCAPCYRFDCPYGLPCLDIPPEEVAAAAIEAVQEGWVRA
ncbi:MAG TPA: glycosyltransferase family 9 protein [Dehalococcoidia bacterium]|nr:glycosyltransferase family 9 protein [Dehalococcoidia bacterium]